MARSRSSYNAWHRGGNKKGSLQPRVKHRVFPPCTTVAEGQHVVHVHAGKRGSALCPNAEPIPISSPCQPRAYPELSISKFYIFISGSYLVVFISDLDSLD